MYIDYDDLKYIPFARDTCNAKHKKHYERAIFKLGQVVEALKHITGRKIYIEIVKNSTDRDIDFSFNLEIREKIK